MNGHDDMSATDVLSTVRDSLCGMPVAGPPDVEAIMARGRAHRRRRLIPCVTGTAAVAAGAALAATALTPASHLASPQPSHPAGRQPAAQLAAWTVAKLADGNISVTIRELADPAGLQSTLRADGVPASVTFASQQNSACRPYPGGTPPQAPQPLQATTLLKRVFPKPYNELPPPPRSGGARWVPANGRPSGPPSPSPDTTVILIDPSALPGSAGVQLGTSDSGDAILTPRVVYASPQCTGS
jgi:hypothetical protein